MSSSPEHLEYATSSEQSYPSDNKENIKPIQLAVQQAVSYSLNSRSTKLVTVGLFELTDNKIGVLFHNKTYTKFVLLDWAIFDFLRQSVGEIGSALRGDDHTPKKRFNLGQGKFKVLVSKVYGKPQVIFTDLKNKKSFYFGDQEWSRFMLHLPSIFAYQPNPEEFYREVQ